MSGAEVTVLGVRGNGRWAATWTRFARATTAQRGVFALACVVLESFAYRLHVARVCSLWLDEVGTHLDSLKPWSVVLQAPTREHPPLMYVLVKAAVGVFGSSEAGLRAVSLVFGCVLLVAAYQLCLELGITVGPGIDRYLVVEIHVDDERRRDLEALVVKKFGISAEEWRSLPIIPMPHSSYQPAVPARIVLFRGDPAPQQPKKARKQRSRSDERRARNPRRVCSKARRSCHV